MTAFAKEPSTTFKPPPRTQVGVLGWLRENLFSNWYNSLLTVISILIIYKVIAVLYQWGIADAVWVAEDRRVCLDTSPDGACWAGVIVWTKNIIYGRYPSDEVWRINLGFALLVVWLAPLWFPRVTSKITIAFTAVFLYPFLAGSIFAGGERSLFMQLMMSLAATVLVVNTIHVLLCSFTGRTVNQTLLGLTGMAQKSESTQRNALIAIFLVALVVMWLILTPVVFNEIGWVKWGGLFLTLVISGIGITTALPGGILLALGRRSQLPVIRILCTGFIEVFRSVPLITILFMATTMFPLFLPEGFVLNKLVQVIVAVCLFNACYMAEVVRAGLQALPKGQYEAADAMGLNYWQMMGLVVMPQALKYMIPNIVGNFIGLLKDTTLVSIIGLFDILNMIQSVSRDVPWRGLHKEPLFFGAVIFFVLCYAMSKYSRHLEGTVGGGHQR